MVKGWLAEDEYHAGISGTYGTRASMRLFEEADCVIAVGASMGRYTTEHGYLYPNARFVHLDSKPHLVMSGAVPPTATCRRTQKPAWKRWRTRSRSARSR